jgi:hypothetical protein
MSEKSSMKMKNNLMMNYLKEMNLLKMKMNTLFFYYNNKKSFVVAVVVDD